MKLPEANDPPRAGPPLRIAFTNSQGATPQTSFQSLRAEGPRHWCVIKLLGDHTHPDESPSPHWALWSALQ